jgi:hypothetical protein
LCIETRYDELIERLRAAARPDLEAPQAAQRFVETVRRHAYRVTDEDVRALRRSGLSEDEIFELTVSTAVSAGLERLDAGLGALRSGSARPRPVTRPPRRRCSRQCGPRPAASRWTS